MSRVMHTQMHLCTSLLYMRVYTCAHKAPALHIMITEEDVDHSAVHLTAVRLEFHAEKQRHTSLPHILEEHI